jgi:hypothetical protein
LTSFGSLTLLLPYTYTTTNPPFPANYAIYLIRRHLSSNLLEIRGCFLYGGLYNWYNTKTGGMAEKRIKTAVLVLSVVLAAEALGGTIAGLYQDLAIAGVSESQTCDYILTGDFNGDCKVDFYDFAQFAQYWLNDDIPDSIGPVIGWGYPVTQSDINNVAAIAAGEEHSIALRKDGSIIGWGSNIYGLQQIPEGNDFKAISAGRYQNLALKADGSIVGWGDTQTPPAGNDFVAIAAGWGQSFALKSDGTIVTWGDINTSPEGNDFIAIAAGEEHALALRSNGTIAGWGYNANGQATPPEGNDFIAIAAGVNHSLALKANGTIVGWAPIIRARSIVRREMTLQR